MLAERWRSDLDAQPVAMVPTSAGLAVGLDDGRVQHLDASTGRVLASIAVHEEGLLTLASSPDGLHLASGGADGRLVLSSLRGPGASLRCRGWLDRVAWVDDARAVGTAGTELARLALDGRAESRVLGRGVMALAASRGVVGVAVSGSLLLVDSADLSRVEEHRVLATGRSLAAHPRGAGWAMGTQEQSLLCLRMSDRRLSRLGGYLRPARVLAFSHDGASLATSGMNALVVWSLPSLDCDRADATLLETDAEPVSFVRFHPSGEGLVVVTKTGSLFVLDGLAGTRVRYALGGPPTSLTFSRTGDWFACATA